MAGWEPMDCTAASVVTEDPGADCAPSAAESSKYSKLQSYLKTATECMEKVQGLTSPRDSANSLKFNNEQCEYLSDKLKLTVQSASLFVQAICLLSDLSSEFMVRCVDTFKLLVAKAKETESFIQGCCKDAWIQAAMTLTNVPEQVSSIGFNLELCRIVFSGNELGASRSRKWTELVDKIEKIDKVEVDIVQGKAFRDEVTVRKKVLLELGSLKGTERELATFLLQRLERLDTLGSTSSASSWGPFERFFNKVQVHEKLGQGASATVHKVIWLGMEVAKKIFHGSNNEYFDQEVSVLPGVFHANVLPLFCCTTSKRACSIFMELMDKDLSSLMRDRLQNLDLDVPFSNFVVVDIILQLAEGMLCLHSKNIVHRDLKADNVLVKVTDMENGYLHAKLADFGLSKTKESSCSTQTFNTGTNRYMAPEVINFYDTRSQSNVPPSVNARKYPQKSDVFSFGMVCFEILTGDVPYSQIKNEKEVKRKIKSGDCPPLPDHCPPILRTLIESCWKFDPKDRPTFAQICKVLKCVKYLLMTTGGDEGGEIFHGSNTFMERSGEMLTTGEQDSNIHVLLPPVNEDWEFIPEGQFPVKEINVELGEAVDHKQHYDLVEQMVYLFVRVARAQDLLVKDKRKSIDPYVRIIVKDLKMESKIVKQDNSPAWYQVFAISRDQIRHASLELSVWNADVTSDADDFLGGFMVSLQEVPVRKPPKPRIPSQWYTLETKHGMPPVRGAIQVSIWWGTQADENFDQAWLSDCGGHAQFRSRVYLSPKLWYLRVNVIEATNEMHLSELSVRINVGPYQSLRTSKASVRGSFSDAFWNEDLMFVVAEPFDDMMHLSVVDPKDEVLGHVRVPLNSIERRIDDRPVASRWYILERNGGERVENFGEIHLRLCLEGGYHVMDELPNCISDTRPTATQLWNPPVGELGLGILGANNLLPMKAIGSTDAYCVAKYGPKWTRTRCIRQNFNPRWNEQFTWEVYDPCTILTICVFDNGARDGIVPGAMPIPGKHLPIGKVQIRLSTLEKNRVYTKAFPLLVTTSQGVKKMGELALAFRFSCAPTVNPMQTNLQPQLPRMHHLNPLDPSVVEDLRVAAMDIVALQFKRSKPPLKEKVIQFMLLNEGMIQLMSSKQESEQSDLSSVVKVLENTGNPAEANKKIKKEGIEVLVECSFNSPKMDAEAKNDLD